MIDPAPVERIYTAAIAIIGDEILSGRTQDRNVQQIALWLNMQGIRLREVRIVADVEADIIEAVNALRARYDYLFTTGGIGPTHDDITVDAIARAFGVPVVLHADAEASLAAYYADKGGVNEGRSRMARVPEGASLIANPVSGAPGIKVGNVHIMAGIPNITAGMLQGLTGTLAGGLPVVSVVIGAIVKESEVVTLLASAERAHPGCQVGSYPFYDQRGSGADFVVRSTDAVVARACADAIAAGLEQMGVRVVEGGYLQETAR